jgi:hypothetical protein
MKLSEFDTDRDLEINGVWVDLEKDGAQLLIARIGNPSYNRLLQEKIKPVKILMQQDRLDIETQDDIMVEILARTILLDWKGFTDDKGKPVKYTPKRGEEMLRKRDFRKIVEEVSDAQATFKAAVEEADAGNSSAS